MLIASRIFGLTIEGLKTDALVPYADMLNHKRPKETLWYYCDEKRGFVVTALQKIKRGDPVYYSYGSKCNSRFLMSYGFTNPRNDSNERAFEIELQENDANFSLKREMMGGEVSRNFILDGFASQ